MIVVWGSSVASRCADSKPVCVAGLCRSSLAGSVCFGGVQGFVCKCTVLQSFFSSQRCTRGLHWQALFSRSEDCRGALAHLSLLLRCSYLFLAETQVY